MDISVKQGVRPPLVMNIKQVKNQSAGMTKTAATISNCHGPVTDRVRAELTTLPEADMEKVEEIKKALQDGQFDLGPASLSQCMTKYYRGTND